VDTIVPSPQCPEVNRDLRKSRSSLLKHIFSTIPSFTPASTQPEYRNNGMMGSWIGITLKEVGGASASGGLEAEGQEFFASCLSEAILKRSALEPKGTLSPFLIPNIPTFHRSIGFNWQSELLFQIPRWINVDFPRLQPCSPTVRKLWTENKF
jgi:hypothetical protein